MKKYPLLYFTTNIIRNKEWKLCYFEITSRKKIHFQLEQNIYKEKLYSKKPSLMLLVVTLQHFLLCYEGGCAFVGVEVGLLPPDDWLFTTTQTKKKKSRNIC